MAIVYVTTDGAKWGAGSGVSHPAPTADNNFWEVVQRILALETTPPVAVSIDDFSVVGNQMTVLLTDTTTRGPYLLPTATWKDKGEWLPATVYQAADLVKNAGKTYLVLHNHTSEAVFDPEEFGVDGFLYSLILEPASTPNDLHVFVGGLMNDAQLILRYHTTRRWQLPDDLVGSLFLAGVAADDDTVITFRKGATSIGTLTWSAAGTVPVVVFPDAITFEVGDTFRIEGPATADIALADISFDILANRL